MLCWGPAARLHMEFRRIIKEFWNVISPPNPPPADLFSFLIPKLPHQRNQEHAISLLQHRSLVFAPRFVLFSFLYGSTRYLWPYVQTTLKRWQLIFAKNKGIKTIGIIKIMVALMQITTTAVYLFYVPSMCHSGRISHLTNSDSIFKALLFRRVSPEQKRKKKRKGATANSRAPLLCEMNCLSAGGKGAHFIKTSSFLQLNYEEDTLACTRACSRVSTRVSDSNMARLVLYKVTPRLLWKWTSTLERKKRVRKE